MKNKLKKFYHDHKLETQCFGAGLAVGCAFGLIAFNNAEKDVKTKSANLYGTPDSGPKFLHVILTNGRQEVFPWDTNPDQ